MQKLYMPKFVTVDKRELKSALRLTLGKRFIEPTAKEMNTKKRNVQGWLSTTKAVPEALLELIRRKLPETEERMPGSVRWQNWKGDWSIMKVDWIGRRLWLRQMGR